MSSKIHNILVISGPEDEINEFKQIFKIAKYWNERKGSKWSTSIFTFLKPIIAIIVKKSREFKNIEFYVSYLLPEARTCIAGRNIIKNGENRVEREWSLQEDQSCNEISRKYAKSLLYIFHPKILYEIMEKTGKFLN